MSPLTVLSRPHPTVWQITLSAPPDNRLTTKLLDSLTDNLDIIEAEWRRASGKRDQQGPMSDPKTFGEHKGAGAVIITGQDRFFSNGLDYSNAMANKYFFEEVYDKAMYRLLTFPLATIAAVNGHAFAGGMCLALSCDFRLMTSGKGLMCMNELAFGSPIPNSFAALLRAKIPHPSHLRETLMAKRWNQQELLEIGLVDEIVDSDKLLEAAVARGVREGARVGAGAWGAIKDGLYHEIIDASKTFRPIALPMQEAEAFWKRVGRDKGKL